MRENSAAKDVRATVNALELIGICCEGGMVDEQVIKRTFRDAFIQLYEAIGQCRQMQSLGRDGQALLRENPAATTFYHRLKKEQLERDKLAKV